MKVRFIPFMIVGIFGVWLHEKACGDSAPERQAESRAAVESATPSPGAACPDLAAYREQRQKIAERTTEKSESILNEWAKTGDSASVDALANADLELQQLDRQFAKCHPELAAGAMSSEPDKRATQKATAAPRISRSKTLAARRKFSVIVLDFDSSKNYGLYRDPPDSPGELLPSSDRVRVRVTNGSNVALPYLTLRVNRFGSGEPEWSRHSVKTDDIQPGKTAERIFYPRGQMPGTQRIEVEVEASVQPGSERFFKELQ